MALKFALAGASARSDGNRNAVSAPQCGNTTNVASGAASANVALPVDLSGKTYAALLLTTTAACWVQFQNNNTDTVAAAAPGAILLPANFWDFIGIPDGATFIAAIQDTVAGKVGVTGIF